MQKKLLGIAVAVALAAPGLALAQSGVQVYGTVHMSINQVKFGDATGSPAGANAAPSATGSIAAVLPQGTTKMGVAQHASNSGLRSTEPLGSGLTAWFQAEFNMLMERTNGVIDNTGSFRNSGVGLRGGFGNVYVGTWETPWAQTFRLWDVGTIGGWGPTTSIIGRRETTGGAPSRNCSNPSGAPGAASTAAISNPVCGQADAGNASFGNSVGASTSTNATAAAGATNLGYPLWRRYGHALFYEAPIFEGAQFKVAYQPNESKSVYLTPVTTYNNSTSAFVSTTSGLIENPSSWSASLTWTGLGGRARAFIANMQAKDYSSVGQSDSGWTFGGGYDFGMANVGATYEKYTYKVQAGD